MLINQPTADTAGGAGTTAVGRGDVTGSVAVSCNGSADANSTLYTCPAGSYVEGHVYVSSSSTYGRAEVRVNGEDMEMQNGYYQSGNYSASGPHALSLGPGDTLATGSTNYSKWGFTGLVRQI